MPQYQQQLLRAAKSLQGADYHEEGTRTGSLHPAGRTFQGYILHPFSTFRSGWDVMISALLLVTIVGLPLNLAFEAVHASMIYFILFMDICFIADLIFHFITG